MINELTVVMPSPPDPALDRRDTFSSKATAFTVAMKQLGDELTPIIPQINAATAGVDAAAVAAADSATAAGNSATAASASAAAAAASQAAAATSYDSFDDRYLGAKAVAPTLDNDGNALMVGALYWNTGTLLTYVWSGADWNVAGGDPIAIQNQSYTAFTTGGTSTAYTLTPTPTISAYTAGKSFWITFHAASGANPTLAISGVASPPNLVKQNGDGTYSNIASNDIPAGHRSQVTLLSATQALVEKLPASVANGGTGATDAATARTNLGAAGTAALAASSGSSLIGWIRSAISAVATTVARWLGWQPLSVFEFMTEAEIASVQAGAFATDVTVPVQAALTAAGLRRCKRVIAPAGGYLLSATLTAPYGVEIEGEGFEFTKFYRTGDYGDTLQFGATGAGNGGGPGRVSGIWFKHGTAYTSGDAALDNKATSGAHIRFYGCQRPIVEDCWFWRLQYSLVFEGGSTITVRDCNTYGIFDHTVAALQEGTAQIYLKKSADFGSPVTVRIENHKFNGSNVPARNVTLNPSDGPVVKSMTELTGSQYGLLCDGGEDIEVSGGYAGGFNEACLQFIASNTGIVDIRVHDIHFDGARNAQIAFTSSGTEPCLGVTIANNVFNGELLAGNAIAAAGAVPVLVNFAITGNTCFQHYRSNFNLQAANGGTVSGNVISSYNTLGASVVDDQWVAGIYCVNSYTKNISIFGNTIGGGGNGFDVSTANTFTYKGVVIANTCVRVVAHNNFYAGIRDGSNFRTGIAQTPNQHISTSVENWQMGQNEDVYIRSYAAAALNGVFLPQYPMAGREVVVKDGYGDGATYNISIATADSTTIDGSATALVSTNFGSKRFRFNGTQWNAV